MRVWATELAHRHLDSDLETTERLEKVRQLIEGYETPYGMELLATIHWLASHEEKRATTLDEVIAGFQTWPDKTGRKASLFKKSHIATAWGRLKQQGWV